MSTHLAVPALTDAQRQTLTDVRSPYSAEDRLCVAMCYIVEGGNSAAAARRASPLLSTEIEAGTIRQWKSRAAWFPQAEEIARKMLQQDLDRQYTQFLDQTQKEMLDRVQHGNHQVVNGELIRVPVPLRELATGHGIISDKRAMVRGEPTSRKENTGVEMLLQLAAQLQKAGSSAKTALIEGDYEVIENDDE